MRRQSLLDEKLGLSRNEEVSSRHNWLDHAEHAFIFCLSPRSMRQSKSTHAVQHSRSMLDYTALGV